MNETTKGRKEMNINKSEVIAKITFIKTGNTVRTSIGYLAGLYGNEFASSLIKYGSHQTAEALFKVIA